MQKFCLYSDKFVDAPCFSIAMHQYSYLPQFLNDERKSSKAQSHSVPMDIQCVKPKSKDGFDINDNICINCMFCVFGCTGNRIRISKQTHPTQFCYDITQTEFLELQELYTNKLFRGKFIEIPKVPLSQIRVKYKSFEQFTGVNETANISVWTANTLKFLSQSLEPRVALEVGVDIKSRDRNGRLDVSLLNTRDNYLFVAEAKVSFEAMMADKRFEAQLLGYQTELIKNSSDKLKMCKFLVIGDRESDLLPPNHPDSTSSPIRATEFYDILRQRHFFFFSANALLALGLMKMFVSQAKFCLENLYSIITNPNYVGILSSGAIDTHGNIIPLLDIV